MRDDIERAGKLQDLTRPEHLLVWALRMIALGQEDCPLLVRTFGAECGPYGPEALGLYHVVVKSVATATRRNLKVHVPGCPCVGPDEVALVRLIAAAQQSLGGDEAALRMEIAVLIEGEASEFLVFATQVVARILQASGHLLSYSPPRLKAFMARPASTLVH